MAAVAVLWVLVIGGCPQSVETALVDTLESVDDLLKDAGQDAPAGDPNPPPADPPPANELPPPPVIPAGPVVEDYDGAWLAESPGTTMVMCLTIQEGRVINIDDGCHGGYFSLSDADRGVMVKDWRIVWRLEGTTRPEWQDMGWTFDVTGPPTGPLVGTSTVGQVIDAMIMTRLD